MNRQEKQFGVIAALSGFIAVALGAFGAHALKGNIHESLLAAFETATHYHLVHSVVLFVVALGFGVKDGTSKTSAWAFVAGIVLFSGSLYLMALTGLRTLGMITPFGGVSFLVGWGALAMAIWRR